MGTGDYICVTLRGCAPWGFTLREGEGDTYIPFLVSQVEEDGRAFLAGIQDGDEVVSINGEPCADLTFVRALALIDASIDCLQLLVKRYHSIPVEDCESEGERASSSEPVETTTLHIFSEKNGNSQFPRELYISESQNEASYEEFDNTEFQKGAQLLWTQLRNPSSDDEGQKPDFEKNSDEVQRCFSPGDMVELQVSFSDQTLDDIDCASLGSARGIEGGCSTKETFSSLHTATSHHVPSAVREPLGQHGVVVSSSSVLGQEEGILQTPAGSGRGIVGVGGPRVSESVGSQSVEEGGGGGHYKCVPESFTVSFDVPSEEGAPAEEQDSDSEGDQDKPNKHHARHARLRRSESQSEKQLKEAKSKCKRIALLLTAAPSNPNNRGVLMFKKHRQRAKKYTLVSYGTGEDEPDYSDDDEDESGDDKPEIPTIEFTLKAHNGSTDKHLLTNANSRKGVPTINWDKGLLEIERNLNNQTEMECLPETKGKGAVMFAQRRLRMDEISAEHEELRRQGIPVESVQETEKKMEHSYMQASTEGHAYMDVNMHQQSQHQYQQYQEQQYYEQQQKYQQQQQYQQQYQQQQQQQQQIQYEQNQYQQQQAYQQQQEYHQEQQHMQHYATNINGTVQHQINEMQSSFSNRTAKPFSAENMAATPYAMSGNNQESGGQAEQIASRDERISTPAIKTGFLSDARKRGTGKPMFTFKEAPKVSPNPELLNLLNRSDKKGFESGPEEDYLSLGAEACNFLQSLKLKQKNPPPVAPKPVINPNCPPWSPQMEATNQDMPQCAENSLSTPAAAPTAEAIPAPELEPTPAPAPAPATAPAPAPATESSSPPAPQETPASTTAEQHTWTSPEPESQQQPLQVSAQEANGHMNSTLQSASSHVTSWSEVQAQAQQSSSSSWQQVQVQPEEQPARQSPTQPTWATRQSSQNQAQIQQSAQAWNAPAQPSWAEPQMQQQPQSQVHPSWSHPNEQQHMQQIQPTWAQTQEPMQQQPQGQWGQQSQTESQPLPPWLDQPQKKAQAQPPWVQQAQPESQPQPQWAQQPQHQPPPQQWSQTQVPGQPQPPWVSAQPQQQQQPSINTWPQAQAHAQPPWIQAQPPAQPQAQPQACLNPWAPEPAQVQSQPQWTQSPPVPSQHSWGQEQPQAHSQPPWAQPAPQQPTQQPSWQQPTSNTPPQPPMNTWSPAQTQPQLPVNTWTSQSQQTPVSVPTPNTRPSPKPWQAPQNAPQSKIPPLPPQRMHSFTIGQRASSPINPMATVLNPSSAGSAFEMPVVRGKGADMFAKRQSRMEKFVVDSETVEANKASRSTSPAASLPNEWKYTPNAFGRSYSLSPPVRVPSTGQKSISASSSPRPPARAPTTPLARQTSGIEQGRKPLTPWEAASRHPLGLVDEAFTSQKFQQTLASNVCLAAQRKMLPRPPIEWKSRVSYQAPQKTGSQTWSPSQSRSQSRAPIPSFVPQARSPVSSHAGYSSLPRQWQTQRSNLWPSVSSSECKRPPGTQAYKSVCTSNTWSWRR